MQWHNPREPRRKEALPAAYVERRVGVRQDKSGEHEEETDTLGEGEPRERPDCAEIALRVQHDNHRRSEEAERCEACSVGIVKTASDWGTEGGSMITGGESATDTTTTPAITAPSAPLATPLGGVAGTAGSVKCADKFTQGLCIVVMRDRPQ